MLECCREYDINSVSVRDRAKRMNCSWIEAVKHYKDCKNNGQQKLGEF